MRSLLSIVFCVVCCLTTPSPSYASSRDFNESAKDLIKGIEKNTDRLPGLRVALIPFDQDDIPVRVSVANSYNDALLQALLKRNRRNYQFIARSELSAIINDMEKTGASSTTGDNLDTLMSEASQVDVLITGKIERSGNSVSLSFKAVDTQGSILAASRPRTFELSATDDDINASNLTLDRGLLVAAEHFFNSLPDMDEVQEGGVRFQTTGTQPPAGLYIQEKIIAGLSNTYSNMITDRRLRVKKPSVSKKKISGLRGISMTAKQLETATASDHPGSYTLNGTYWNFGDLTEIRLSLTNATGESISWNDRVRKDSFPPGLGFEPKETLNDLRENDALGPIKIRLSTSHGEDPVYRVGDSMDLIIQTERDSWLYCFYREANGKTLQIFPNPYFLKSYPEPFIQGNRVYVIPGDDIFPFELTVQEPLGVELLKCFAASKNISSQLPDALRGLSLEALPPNLDRSLSATFRQVLGASITENSMVITVTQ